MPSAADGSPFACSSTTRSTIEAAKGLEFGVVVVAGLGIAFSEGGSGLRKLVWVALGLSIAFAATTFFLPLFAPNGEWDVYAPAGFGLKLQETLAGKRVGILLSGTNLDLASFEAHLNYARRQRDVDVRRSGSPHDP